MKMTFGEYKQIIVEIWTKYKLPIPSDEDIKTEWGKDTLIRK